MANRQMTCKKCGEQFELRPGKPGYANVCEDCTSPAPVPIPLQVKAESKPVRAARKSSFASLVGCMDDLIACMEELDGKRDETLRGLRDQFVGSQFCK